MPGTSSEPANRRIRLIGIYASPWWANGANISGELPDFLDLWRLEAYYRLSANQLPAVAHCAPLDVAELQFRRWKDLGGIESASSWLFLAPSGQVVAAISINLAGVLLETVELLEDGFYRDFLINDQTAEEHFRDVATKLSLADTSHALLPEHHQLVLSAEHVDGELADTVQRLIYRTNRPYRAEHSVIKYPGELNRRPSWLSAVGPYVSVSLGHPAFIQNAIFASAVQVVAAAARLRSIRHAAYEAVSAFRDVDGGERAVQVRRRTLENITDRLSDLELELSFSVEASADVGMLIPSLRIEGFHTALFESMGLSERADRTGRMLDRLAEATRADLTATQSIERRLDELRRRRYAATVGFVSAVAIPISLILGFLGINASQVNGELSMFDASYRVAYLSVAGIVFVALVVFVGMWTRHRRAADVHRAFAGVEALRTSSRALKISR